MLFNSPEFLFFFLPCVVIVGLVMTHYLSANAFLAFIVLASLFFYAWDTFYWVFILMASIAVNYTISRIMDTWRGVGRRAGRQWVFVAGLVFNLALLGYFKYTGFLVENVTNLTGASLPGIDIVLPIGISFYTFQQIAYLVDCYRGAVTDRHFLRYAFFISFFPQLIAGPIVHHSELVGQLKQRFRGDVATNLALGTIIFLIGLAKKILLADTFAQHASPVFALADAGESISTGQAWMAMIAYSLQIYFDFSGYSDMAIGIARMFGLKLPVNFASPYQATSIIEFWRRWHITLSRFLRDYLYIPLGGNRGGALWRYKNLMLTMVLGGLWHGAGWGFVIWGALHGVFLIINHWFRSWFKTDSNTKQKSPISRMWSPGFYLTLLVVTLAWVPFRAETLSGALTVWTSLWPPELPALTLSMGNSVWVIIAGCIAVVVLPNTQQIMQWLFGYDLQLATYANYREKGESPVTDAPPTIAPPVSVLQMVLRYALVVIVALGCVVGLAVNNQVAEFIYFQF